jgi:integrase
MKDVGGHITFGPPKTSHSRRTIDLPAFLRDMLHEHLTLPLGGSEPDALVFTAKDGGPLRQGLFYGRYFRPATKKALPPHLHKLRFHDLRHATASLLIAAGVSLPVIQAVLGHSSITVTIDRYGHLVPGLLEAAAGVLDAAYRAPAQPEPDNVRQLRPAEEA